MMISKKKQKALKNCKIFRCMKVFFFCMKKSDFSEKEAKLDKFKKMNEKFHKSMNKLMIYRPKNNNLSNNNKSLQIDSKCDIYQVLCCGSHFFF